MNARTTKLENKLIGACLRRARLRAKLTQGEVAAALGVNPPNVSAIESGQRGISLERLFVLADLFGVEPKCLVPTNKERAEK